MDISIIVIEDKSRAQTQYERTTMTARQLLHGARGFSGKFRERGEIACKQWCLEGFSWSMKRLITPKMSELHMSRKYFTDFTFEYFRILHSTLSMLAT